MRIMYKTLAGTVCAAALLIANAANAAVIAGPTLGNNSFGWTVSGLSFSANVNTFLTAFTYQNQGQADTIVLTDTGGNVLQSVSTPGSSNSHVANVNWALTSGQTYWLLQTVLSNTRFTGFFQPLPSNADITIVYSGAFANSIAGVVANSNNIGANDYWTAFNDITTGGAAVPEPATWALMIGGFGMAGATLRRRRAAIAA